MQTLLFRCAILLAVGQLILPIHAAHVASALDPAPALEHDEDAASRLRLTFTAGVWLPRLGGDVSLASPGSEDEISIEEQLMLDELEPSPSFELDLTRNEDWTLRFSGAYFETDFAGEFSGEAAFGSVLLHDGEPFESSLDLATGGIELHYPQTNLITLGEDGAGGNGSTADLIVSPMLALRYVDVDHTVEASGEREHAGGEWLAPMIGFDTRVLLRPESFPALDCLDMQGGIAVGPALGGDGGVVYQVRAGLTWHFSAHASVLFGYRLLELDVENDGYELQGGLQGLFLAGRIRF